MRTIKFGQILSTKTSLKPDKVTLYLKLDGSNN